MVKTINTYKRLTWIGAIVSASTFSLTGDLFFLIFVVANVVGLMIVPNLLSRIEK